MQIKHLELTHFRNYHTLSLDLHPGLTIVTGENAQGKTNLLEAIFLLSLAKSHRTNHDQEMIQWTQEFAKISAEIENNLFTFPLEIILSSKGKIAKYNYIDQSKLSQFIGKLNVVLFSPEDMQLVKGSPGIRRKFIDSELGQFHPVYLQKLLKYNQILKQRNTYLKQIKQKNIKYDSVYFDIITEQLIETATSIIHYRINFIKELQEFSRPLHFSLSNQRDELRIEYKASSSKLDYSELDNLKRQLEILFNQVKAREIDQAVTLYGPHRDDILFYVNNNLAQQFASQGQQRTIVLSIKLAELHLIEKSTGEYPVLLLDDVLSELDDHRQNILMEQIENKVQTILTTATIENINLQNLNNSEIICINQGTLKKESIQNVRKTK
ncbi:DNA replication/repair protein RecF [Facklamia sp. DSM 111018]|uniref:DNA replication and repair protein RecF n=1 Tax=Facklamia lactis TaxID=2749967 RepID=A0ABS0LSS3_9LACT|nr:DNA replication/repair protein RecF [Facklamia lactis]MBG9981308.1 DNA replication/repair protein RecF [Facklamia lactis]MBG9987216.1 DNA replication/repair protein RecF [Facklamia lactis]